jgi:hypothetical protein
MSLVRRGVFFLISLLLLAGLVGFAYAISNQLTLSQPERVEKTLAESKFYDSFAANIIKQAEDSSIGGVGQSGIPFSDPLIQEAAKQSLNAEYLQSQGKILIDNNYQWLRGEKQQPDFRLDLTPAREDFARIAGQALTSKLQSLPACGGQQPANSSPTALACLPQGTDPKTVGNNLTNELRENSTFLNNPLITPTSLNPADSSTSQPYYEKFAGLPAAYQLSLKMPYIFGGLTALALLALYLIAAPKRRFVRRLAAVLTTAGVFLVLNKIITDLVFNRIREQTFQNGGIGALEQSVLDFIHRITDELARIDLYFGIAYLVLAIILFIALRRSRGSRKTKSGPLRAFTAPPASGGSQTGTLDNQELDERLGPPSGLSANDLRVRRKAAPPKSAVVDIAPSSRPTTAPLLPNLKQRPQPPQTGSQPQPQSKPPRKRPPRLIQ